jgi:hypothetical protein
MSAPLYAFMACTKKTFFLLVTTEHPDQQCVQNVNIFSYFIQPQNQLTAWTCHTTLPPVIISDMRLHKRKIIFLPIMHISVQREASVLNYINFLILYYALFTPKSPLFFGVVFHQHMWPDTKKRERETVPLTPSI